MRQLMLVPQRIAKAHPTEWTSLVSGFFAPSLPQNRQIDVSTVGFPLPVLCVVPQILR
jgi:hypothetical protein